MNDRKSMKKTAILGGLLGGFGYLFFVVVALLFNLAFVAGVVYVVVWVLQNMGVL